MVDMKAPAGQIDALDERFIDLISTVEALVEAEFEDILRATSAGCPQRGAPRNPLRGRARDPGVTPSTERHGPARGGTVGSERSPPPVTASPSGGLPSEIRSR